MGAQVAGFVQRREGLEVVVEGAAGMDYLSEFHPLEDM